MHPTGMRLQWLRAFSAHPSGLAAVATTAVVITVTTLVAATATAAARVARRDSAEAVGSFLAMVAAPGRAKR
jgi:hypothetical protein